MTRFRNNQSKIGKGNESVWKKGMGSWLGPTTWGPIPALILALLIGIVIDPVYAMACEVDKCWNLYNTAQQGIADGQMLVPADSDGNCIPVRTYHQCLKNMSSSCYGDIKFHSILKVVEARLKYNNCTKQGTIYKATLPSTKASDKATKKDECAYKGTQKFRHCGLFGDPHLRTFSGLHQTCRVQGAWSLVDNEHLLIQVTNQPVGQYGSATAASKLTVIIRQNDACASQHFLTYQAYTDYLPAVFDNGLGAYGPDDAVRIEVQRPGRRVAIHIRHIATTIILNQVGRYFTFAIKMPDEIIKNSKSLPYRKQLCMTGCPKRERIKFKQYLTERQNRLKTSTPRVAMSREVAEKYCRETNVMDFYLDSCVFDLMMTGDTNFTLAAHAAWRDMLGLVPEAESESKYQTLLNGAERTLRRRDTSGFLLAFFIAILFCTYSN